MTKDNIVTMYKNFPLLSNLVGAKFAYFVARNMSIMKPEAEAIQATLKGTPEFNKYEEGRVALAKENAEKDQDGKPKTQMGVGGVSEYVMKDPEGWAKIFKAYNDKHKKVLDAREKQNNEYNALLKEKAVLKLHKIKMEHVPTNISVAQMNIIIDLIEAE